MRIDRLGKIGSTSGGGPLGWCAGRYGQAHNTAIQQVGVYHIQDAQIGIDSSNGAWLAHDGGWGSEPIATLVIWSDAGTTAQVSHHFRTANACDSPTPRLGDVSRLLEAILLEMPTYISDGLRLSVHGIFDVPFPIGILHAWMTGLEVKMNDLVTRLSTQYHRLGHGTPELALLAEQQPFGVAFEKAWLTPWVVFGLFMISVIIAVLFNFSSSDSEFLLDPESMFPLYSSDSAAQTAAEFAQSKARDEPPQ
ncbi:hypothetical protein FRC07_003295 [Ceratobasidium sp. 392]|nr:hypothetical protein FRC07_003295 [Ceratobasidium sp. 392]